VAAACNIASVTRAARDAIAPRPTTGKMNTSLLWAISTRLPPTSIGG
jgi:hypothetical protein